MFSITNSWEIHSSYIIGYNFSCTCFYSTTCQKELLALKGLLKTFFGSGLKLFICNRTCPKHVNRESGNSLHAICQQGVKKHLCFLCVCGFFSVCVIWKEVLNCQRKLRWRKKKWNSVHYSSIFFLSPIYPVKLKSKCW